MHDADELQTALTAAIGRTAATTIELASGTYQPSAGVLGFDSTTAGQGQLDISGGYNSDCSSHVKNPALTVIDVSASVVTNGGVLDLESTGGISVRYLTLEGSNGAHALFASVNGGSGGIIMDYNIVHNVTGTGAIGAEILGASASGNIHVDSNLIVDNVGCCGSTAAGGIFNLGTGDTYFTNNTVADNTNTPSTAIGGITIQTVANANVSNNIFWNNTSADLYLRSFAILVNNDYTAISGPGPAAGSSGNVAVDPQFMGLGDFHLSANSPLIDQGTLTPAGGLPTIDIEGLARTFSGTVDMGAYERGDGIFSDGFGD